MVMTLEQELEELQADEVACRRCSHGYTAHEPGGGHCRGILSNGPMHRLPCMCPGMRWVDPVGERPSYGAPPTPAAP